MVIDFYELLDLIRQQPAMYISEKSITLLYGFLTGYTFALGWSEVSKNTAPPFNEFNDWVAMKLGLYESTSGWRNMLLKAENGDEEKAVDRFFIYLDEFKQRQATVILWVKLPTPTTPKVWRYLIDGDKRIAVPPPSLVHIIKYTDDKGVFIRYGDENNKTIEERYSQDLDDAFFWTEPLVKKDEWRETET